METPYSLTKLQTLFRKNVALMAKRSLANCAEETEHAAAYPHDLLNGLAGTGLLSLLVPRSLGGQGAGMFELALALEEMASVCPASALMAASQNLGSGLIAGWGDDAQQADWLPDLMNGKLRFGHLSPPVTALDPTATPLSIRENGNGGVLDGGPVWLVNGAGADLLAVWAKGAEQTSFLLFPAADLAGAILDPGGRTGLDAIAPVLIDMEGLNLPASVFLAGQKPETMSWFTSAAALAHAAVGMGAARGAHEYALEYSKKRYQFGMPIGKFQAVRELLAEMALAVEAARQLTLKACAAHDAGQDQAQKLSHMARLMAVRCSAGATEQAVQVCGGYGYTKEYPVEKMMRLAQLCKVLDGGDQAQVQALAAAL